MISPAMPQELEPQELTLRAQLESEFSKSS